MMQLTEQQIEFMKNNRVQWGMLTAKEQELFGQPYRNGDCLMYACGSHNNINDDIIRLRPDWQPEEAEVKIPELLKNGHRTQLGRECWENDMVGWAHSIEKRLRKLKKGDE